MITLLLGSLVLAAVDITDNAYVSPDCTGTAVSNPQDYESCDLFLQYVQQTCTDYSGTSCESITFPACFTGDFVDNWYGSGVSIYFACVETTDSPTEVPTEATCEDNLLNGNETRVDCGGVDCPACPPDCQSYDCGATHILVDDADTVYCAADPCDGSDLDTCCEQKALCSTFTCTGALVLISDAATTYCLSSECDVIDDRDQCCADPATCENFDLCDSTSQYLKSNPATFDCDSTVCGASDIANCCEDKALCSSYSCDFDGGKTLVSDSGTIYCELDTCTDSDSSVCCTDRASCDGFACGDSYVDKTDKSSLFCSGAACVDSDSSLCCDIKTTCSTDFFTFDCSSSENELSPDAYCYGTEDSTCDEMTCCPSMTSSDDSGLADGIIIGIVIGAVVLIAVIAFAVYKRNQRGL